MFGYKERVVQPASQGVAPETRSGYREVHWISPQRRVRPATHGELISAIRDSRMVIGYSR